MQRLGHLVTLGLAPDACTCHPQPGKAEAPVDRFGRTQIIIDHAYARLDVGHYEAQSETVFKD